MSSRPTAGQRLGTSVRFRDLRFHLGFGRRSRPSLWRIACASSCASDLTDCVGSPGLVETRPGRTVLGVGKQPRVKISKETR